jgi:hypothetical protein
MKVPGLFSLALCANSGLNPVVCFKASHALPASKYARLLEMALGVPPPEGFIFD